MKLSPHPGQELPLKICHLADVHLGYRKYNRLTKAGFNQREIDVNFAFQETVDRVIKLAPSAVVIAGDLFHSVRPSNATLTFAFRELRRLASKTQAPVILVAGNHETPRRADSGSALRLLAEIPGVFVADSSAERFVFQDRQLAVHCLPHAALLEEGRVQVRADDSVKWNVLVTHAQVDDDWVSDFGGAQIALPQISVHEWDYIALGHVHMYRGIGLNAAYSGSLEHTSLNIWGEAERNKGFLEVRLPGPKITFHPLTSPREVVVLPPVDATGMHSEQILKCISDAIAAAPGGIESKIVRLELGNVDRESFKLLDHKQLRALRSAALHFSLDVRYIERSAELELTIGRRKKLIDEVRDLLTQYPLQHATSKDVEAVIVRYLTQLESADEASDARAP